MPLFDVPARAGRIQDTALLKKTRTAKRTASAGIKKGNGILGRIAEIKAIVETNLGQYRDEYEVIQNKDLLHEYITDCIGNSYISIDTETDGLNVYQNQIAGICIYTPNQKGAYIPLNHISYVTGVKVENQLPIGFVVDEFNRMLVKNPDIDMFNANFDIRVLRRINMSNIYCTWDGYLASRILNENEPHKNLKDLHNKYCLNGQGDAFRFDDLFKGIPFTQIPIQTGYLYAAHDPVITTELCEYQRKHLRADSDREDIRAMYDVFMNIEMPCVSVVCDMEDAGIKLDLDYAHELSVKYNALLEDKVKTFNEMCATYYKEIHDYRVKHENVKLDDPINIGSPSQIAILLYDILKLEHPDGAGARGTGEPVLQKIDHPIAKAILEYREVSKLISTYIDKLPQCVESDGRIHCNFNQYGADTGRFSSSDPNLQNIPSHNKEIRKMFVATNEEKLVSTDTQQFEVDRWCEVECADEWKCADKIIVGDELLLDDGSCVNVCGISVNKDKVVIDFT